MATIRYESRDRGIIVEISFNEYDFSYPDIVEGIRNLVGGSGDGEVEEEITGKRVQKMYVDEVDGCYCSDFDDPDDCECCYNGCPDGGLD